MKLAAIKPHIARIAGVWTVTVTEEFIRSSIAIYRNRNRLDPRHYALCWCSDKNAAEQSCTNKVQQQ